MCGAGFDAEYAGMAGTELMEVEVDQQLGAEKSQRIVSMVVLIVCGVDENGHRISLPLNLWPKNPEAPMDADSESGGSWSVHAQTYHFRCTRRTGFGNS